MGRIATLIREVEPDFPMDPYGSAMNLWFKVAETIYHVHGYNAVPASWEFSPGAAARLDTDEVREVYYLSVKHLVAIGNLLERYVQQLKLAGKTY